MPYRADTDALEARAAVLERELAALRERAREAAARRETERDLERDLAETRSRLAAAKAAPFASRLDDVRIATPCHAKWDDMVGDETVRFCGKCEKNVYNLSEMTRDAAEALLREKSGSLCARIYRRPDGTVLTADCPVGVRAKRVRRLALFVGGGIAAGAAAGAFAFHSASQATMGSAVPTSYLAQTGEPTLIMGTMPAVDPPRSSASATTSAVGVTALPPHAKIPPKQHH